MINSLNILISFSSGDLRFDLFLETSLSKFVTRSIKVFKKSKFLFSILPTYLSTKSKITEGSFSVLADTKFNKML